MSKKILVLDDDNNILRNIEDLLISEKYEVYSASNGRKGLELLKNIKPDLILCDIMMPHLDGIAFYKHIKNNYDTKLIPFIFLTAKTDLGSIREGLGLGADDYITKPFLVHDLLKTIETRLQKQSDFNEQFESLVKNINMYIPHELRTPLVAIIGFSRLMLTDINALDKNEIKEMAEQILWSAHRLNNRIEKFIFFSDLSLSNVLTDQSNNLTKVNNSFIEKVLFGHFFICERFSSIKLSFEDATINISEHRLKMLISELTENAIKFSDINSEIFIGGKAVGADYFITIKDCGIGMSEDEIEKIGVFKQFSREMYSQDGNGFGLAISIRIAHMYNGEITFESEKGKYTNVKVRLPLYKAQP